MKLKFPHWTLNTTARIYTEERDSYNKPTEEDLYTGKVNHVQQSKQILNSQRELIVLSGWVVVPKDLDISINDMSKPVYVEINGHKQRVIQTNKPNNPDGSIFSTELFF